MRSCTPRSLIEAFQVNVPSPLAHLQSGNPRCKEYQNAQHEIANFQTACQLVRNFALQLTCAQRAVLWLKVLSIPVGIAVECSRGNRRGHKKASLRDGDVLNERIYA